MKRRQFLRHTTTAAAVALLPACVSGSITRLSWLDAAAGATGFGVEGIESPGRAATTERTAAEWRDLLPPVDGIAWTDSGLESDAGKERVIQALRETCSVQYAEGNYGIVDGWVLSELETALCAMAYGAA